MPDTETWTSCIQWKWCGQACCQLLCLREALLCELLWKGFHTFSAMSINFTSILISYHARELAIFVAYSKVQQNQAHCGIKISTSVLLLWKNHELKFTSSVYCYDTTTACTLSFFDVWSIKVLNLVTLRLLWINWRIRNSLHHRLHFYNILTPWPHFHNVKLHQEKSCQVKDTAIHVDVTIYFLDCLPCK